MSAIQADHYREQLYEIKSADLSVEETLRRILEIGREYLAVENGHVKRVDQMDGTHEVLASVGTDEIPIAVVELHTHATTYCRRTIQSETSLAIAHASEEGWAEDPAFQRHGLECYLGSTISVRGEPFGTLCFVARAARDQDFTPTERAFVDLAAGLIGTELADREYERELASKNRLIGVLNRVLRHNLRNDLNAVTGYADVLQSQLDDEYQTMAGKIADIADTLAVQGEKAHRLETIAQESAQPSSRDIVPVVDDVVTTLQDEYPNATIEQTGPVSVEVMTTDHVQLALYELGENAIEHGEDAPTVEFSVEPDTPSDNAVTVAVEDNGPGLPEHDRQVLTGAPETALEHGSGVGLWLVYWIVKQSSGAIAVEVTDGTTIRVELQRTLGPEPIR